MGRTIGLVVTDPVPKKSAAKDTKTVRESQPVQAETETVTETATTSRRKR